MQLCYLCVRAWFVRVIIIQSNRYNSFCHSNLSAKLLNRSLSRSLSLSLPSYCDVTARFLHFAFINFPLSGAILVHPRDCSPTRYSSNLLSSHISVQSSLQLTIISYHMQQFFIGLLQCLNRNPLDHDTSFDFLSYWDYYELTGKTYHHTHIRYNSRLEILSTVLWFCRL